MIRIFHSPTYIRTARADDELLSILGSSDPTSVQPHMLKMFDNCKELSFAKQNKVATKMTSAENETFGFRTHVAIEVCGCVGYTSQS